MMATLALNLAPGPDMLYVVVRSLSQGVKAGIVSALGIAAGCFVHIVLVTFGLAAILNAVPVLFYIVKYCGAAYLIYLGIQTLINKNALASPQILPESLSKIFRDGFITNALNPKVALFFMAFLPQFADAQNFSASVALLGVIFNVSGTLVNIAVAVTAGSMGGFIREKLEASPFFKWLVGGTFILLGFRMALQKRN